MVGERVRTDAGQMDRQIHIQTTCNQLREARALDVSLALSTLL